MEKSQCRTHPEGRKPFHDEEPEAQKIDPEDQFPDEMTFWGDRRGRQQLCAGRQKRRFLKIFKSFLQKEWRELRSFWSGSPSRPNRSSSAS